MLESLYFASYQVEIMCHMGRGEPVVEGNVLEVSTRFRDLIPTNRLEVFSHIH